MGVPLLTGRGPGSQLRCRDGRKKGKIKIKECKTVKKGESPVTEMETGVASQFEMNNRT